MATAATRGPSPRHPDRLLLLLVVLAARRMESVMNQQPYQPAPDPDQCCNDFGRAQPMSSQDTGTRAPPHAAQ